RTAYLQRFHKRRCVTISGSKFAHSHWFALMEDVCRIMSMANELQEKPNVGVSTRIVNKILST
ncbi:hypothetical protein PanWU01x14_243410, partial [Parasponia andersonii]